MPVNINWDLDTIGEAPTETPMYKAEASTVRAVDVQGTVPGGGWPDHMVEVPTVTGNHIHNWRSPKMFDISAGLRVEAFAYFASPSSAEDIYVGLADTFTDDATFAGLPDHCVHAMWRDQDNDVYQRYSALGAADWNDVDNTDMTLNMTPTGWGHYQFEYLPADDELKCQYRNVGTEDSGGFKTLSLTANWNKPSAAYVFFGGLNNSTSFVAFGNVWVGALTDAWPYVGAP